MQAEIMTPGRGGMFIWFKLGKKRPEMEVRTCARIKKVIWDQLLATKAEIIQSLSCIFVLRAKRHEVTNYRLYRACFAVFLFVSFVAR